MKTEKEIIEYMKENKKMAEHITNSNYRKGIAYALEWVLENEKIEVLHK